MVSLRETNQPAHPHTSLKPSVKGLLLYVVYFHFRQLRKWLGFNSESQTQSQSDGEFKNTTNQQKASKNREASDGRQSGTRQKQRQTLVFGQQLQSDYQEYIQLKESAKQAVKENKHRAESPGKGRGNVVKATGSQQRQQVVQSPHQQNKQQYQILVRLYDEKVSILQHWLIPTAPHYLTSFEVLSYKYYFLLDFKLK